MCERQQNKPLPTFKLSRSTPPVGVTSDRVPSLVLIDVDAFDISLCVNVIGAAGQSLEEAPSIPPSVYPGSVVITNPPHYPITVTLYAAQVTSNLPPEPARKNKKLLIKVGIMIMSDKKEGIGQRGYFQSSETQVASISEYEG